MPRKCRKITALGCALLLASGCRGKPQVQGAEPEPVETANVVLPMDQLYVVETWGTPPTDTTVTFQAGRPRTVVIRHAPPDNTVFAELVLPASIFPDTSGGSVQVAIATRPGIYGVTITSSRAFGAGATLTFKYPVHFAAPSGARQRYGNSALFERALAVGVQESDGRVRLLSSTRPAADNLSAAIPGPGTYIVAAPR
jgi:hypothetical protein